MDIYDENKIQLKAIWDSEQDRQHAKIVLFAAISEATDLTAKECDAIFAALDQLLLDKDDQDETRPDPAT